MPESIVAFDRIRPEFDEAYRNLGTATTVKSAGAEKDPLVAPILV